ncbi:MAG: hypothetical protein ICV60_05025 [Pyrinomonadaceae bacterium]|nr:hypothetical protein [Pyrinomonadaceae bacterium]
MSAKNETWQVMCDTGIFETDLEGLKEWVAEGRVLPSDKVRKGNLRWIEAGRAPLLRGAFSPSAAYPVNPSSTVAVSEAMPADHGFEGESFVEEGYEQVQEEEPYAGFDAASFVESRVLHMTDCYYHVGVQPKYICGSCATTFCNDCTKFISKIAVCPLCGELCKLYQEVREKSQRRLERHDGFGFADFSRALSYPFKNLLGLIFGALFYSLLLLGGFKGQLLAYAILFGCISIVINKVVSGRMDANFLPDFGAFAWWDDFLMPILLGLGVTIVTIGPALVLGIALLLGVVNSSSPSPVERMRQEQSQEKPFTREDMDKMINSSAPQSEEALKKRIEEMRPGSSMSRMAERAKDGNNSQMDNLRWLFNGPAIFIPLILLALAWAVFYYPMALSIAGYTENFWSVVNPLVGLDTIRRMGGTYFKAFGMYLIVQVIGSTISMIAYRVLAPFDLPFLGNLPARFVEGSITFYTSLAIACLLGLALYKSADKLGISTD